MEKTCSKCGNTKALSEFYKRKRTRDGHEHHCKECIRVQNQAYYAANRERLRAAGAAWRKANPQRVAADAEKACTVCRETKPLSAFHKDKTQKDGHRGCCGKCACARQRVYRKANAEKNRAACRAWYHANTEYARAQARAWYEAHPGQRRANWLQRIYGLSVTDYAEILKAQEGRCAICGRTAEEEGKRLAVDHDHDTGEVRGLLCGNCNHAIGKFKHDPELLYGAIAYLEQWINGGCATG